jgi:predicted phage terminase large subunit-like protein
MAEKIVEPQHHPARGREVDSLLSFTLATYPQYKPEPFHQHLAQTLDRVVSGELKRLMIFAPPQHGKSELSSVRLPAYWLGKRPDDPVIISSYAADLAYSKSRQARTIVESDDYPFAQVKTRKDSRAVNHWSLAAPYRGGLLAVGVGGPITGHGALLGIIDDPVENWEQAQSQVFRDKTWEWYRTTFRTRIWEDGAIILIMTRWHEDDLAGRLIQEQGNEWEILRYPAIAESEKERVANNRQLKQSDDQVDPLKRDEGEPLAPNRFSRAALDLLKRDVGPYAWAAQYDGVPRPAEGGLFKRSYFDSPDHPLIDADKIPSIAYAVRYWDLAMSEKTSADYTVGWKYGMGVDGHRYVLDVCRDRVDWGELTEYMAKVMLADGPEVPQGIEMKGYMSRAVQKLNADPRLHGYSIFGYEVDKDKFTRALPAAAKAAAGLVHMVNAHWTEPAIAELCSFPNTAHDDQVDAFSGAEEMLMDDSILMIGQVIHDQRQISQSAY